MTFKDKIHYGFLTLNELSTLIDQNKKHAATLNIYMKWEITAAGITATLKERDFLIYKNTFTGNYTHVMLAKMHYNWSLVFDKKIAALKDAQIRVRLLELEAMGGQNHDVTDIPEDTRLTLGERVQKYGIGNR